MPDAEADPPLQPLDYRNPLARDEPVRDAAPPAAPRPAAVVPVEFDAIATRSSDHAAVAAIETALRAAKVPTYRTDDGELAGREITLYCRAADHPRAADVAARIFARRQRVKALQPPKPAAELETGPFGPAE